MEPPKNRFSLGEIVVFRNHPLLYDYAIKGDGKYVPPLMIVKEILFENKQKKTHEENTGKRISEHIKYLCIYFDDNKSEFVECTLYESMIDKVQQLFIGRIKEREDLQDNHIKVVDEVAAYPDKPTYKYGKIVYFKTKKLEVLKKRLSKKIEKNKEGTTEEKEVLQYVVSYSTPEFIICGFKVEQQNDLFYNDGNTKRLASNELVKIQWFNPLANKYSEQYLPIECFTDIQPFETPVYHNEALDWDILDPKKVIEDVQKLEK